MEQPAYPTRVCIHSKIISVRFAVGFLFLLAWISGTAAMQGFLAAIAPNTPWAQNLIALFIFLLTGFCAAFITAKEEVLLGVSGYSKSPNSSPPSSFPDDLEAQQQQSTRRPTLGRMRHASSTIPNLSNVTSAAARPVSSAGAQAFASYHL